MPRVYSVLFGKGFTSISYIQQWAMQDGGIIGGPVQWGCGEESRNISRKRLDGYKKIPRDETRVPITRRGTGHASTRESRILPAGFTLSSP